MYTPKAFALDDPQAQWAFMREHSFATLVTTVDGAITATHLPVLPRPDDNTLLLHLARANPQWQGQVGREVLVMFQGPHAYVSPSVYAAPHPNVPTWNYTAVHAYGIAQIIDDPTAVMALMAATVTEYEAGRDAPWTPAPSQGYAEALVRGVVALRIEVMRIEGKYKLSQNRAAVDQHNVAAAFAGSDVPLERAVGRLMSSAPADKSAG